jgi:hypothetical protein
MRLNLDTAPEFGSKDSAKIREATIGRLASLYRSARLMRLKDCILRGYSANIQEAVKAAAVADVQDSVQQAFTSKGKESANPEPVQH